MPHLSRSVPSYRKHRPSGQAVVTLGGHDFYLGPWDTKTSKLEYDRLVGEWLQQGRPQRYGPSRAANNGDELCINQLIVAYLNYARTYYRKNGRITSEYASIVSALRVLKPLYGRKQVSEFGPVALQAVMQKMVQLGWARGTVNKQTGRIKRMFKWGVAQELISAAIHHALSSVTGLRKGRTDARETAPVLPIEDAIVDATLPYLPEVVADMVAVQRHAGMRPAEVCLLRPINIDRAEDVWVFRPAAHKNEHRGRERVVFIGPRAQAVLLKYLARDPATYCFRPIDSEAKRRAARHADRQTPLKYGNRPGSNRKAKPKCTPGDRYDSNSYRRAIHRGCDKAFPHPTLSSIPATELTTQQQTELRTWQTEHRWSPNRLRHTAGTQIRKQFGLEASRVVLGHSDADTSAIYAERDAALGLQVARKIG